MRIIAGEFRGRQIQAPTGQGTRPMLDRVRQALFGTLRDWLDGARVLDLFSGSGVLALEAVSRGAKSARMIEKNPIALAHLRRNVEELGVGDRVEIVRGDALDPQLWHAVPGYDLVFVDPPYALMQDPRTRRMVLDTLAAIAGENLDSAGRIVLHAPRGLLRATDFSADIEPEVRYYGTNAIWYLASRRKATA